MNAIILLALRIGLVIALYTFLGWALYILWKSLKHDTQETPKQKIAPLVLMVHDKDGILNTHSFVESPVIIGRDPISDLHIDDKTISARHARLSYQLGQWWINDLNSTNGTFLNDMSVHDAVVLTTNDELRCGRIEIDVEIVGADNT